MDLNPVIDLNNECLHSIECIVSNLNIYEMNKYIAIFQTMNYVALFIFTRQAASSEFM